MEVDDLNLLSTTSADAQTSDCALQVAVDTVPPEVSLAWEPANYSMAVALTLVVAPSEELEGFAPDSLVLTNAVAAGAMTREGLLYRLPVTAAAEGAVEASLGAGAAADGAGNGIVAAATAVLVYDSSPPQTTALSGAVSAVGAVRCAPACLPPLLTGGDLNAVLPAFFQLN